MPNRLPLAVKELRGTARPGRTRNEPRPRRVHPRMPKDLAPGAQVFWRKLAPVLGRLGLFTEADALGLAELCTCLAFEAEANKLVQTYGLLIKGGRPKELVKNPACQLSRDFGIRAWALAQQFGLTPASRGRLSVTAPAPGVDPLELILAMPESQIDEKETDDGQETG